VTGLRNKTALVTGASRGIGRATASALAETGANVLVHYGRSAQEAESLVSEIQTKGGSANAISADLGTRWMEGCSRGDSIPQEENGYRPVYYLPRDDADISLPS
jgi:NAD(P)-dependent dehydrogenase (short-subunit alcohol dehydrogenase family)